MIKRILIACGLALASLALNAATLSPIQLLNPAGSTAGQAIVSTGSSTAPAWGGVAVNGIAAIAANSVVANATGSSASPTAVAMPSCSTSTSALQWTSGTGFTCYGSSASLTGATFTGGVTLSYSGPVFTLNDTSGTGFPGTVYKNNGTQNWALHATSSSNGFSLDRYVSGTFTDSPISVANSTGLVTFADGITANGTNTIAGYAALAGATFTGASGIGYGNATWSLNDTSGSNGAHLSYKSSGTQQWDVHSTSSTNGLSFDRYSSGTFADTPISISGSTGVVTFADGITSNGIITPSTTNGIKGTAAADSANAGSVGEYVSSSNTTGTSLTSATPTNITSLTLTAGDWYVWGNVYFNPSATGWTAALTCINTTSATLQTGPSTLLAQINPAAAAGMAQYNQIAPPQRVNVSSSTTVYLVGYMTFSSGTVSAYGSIYAWRRR